MKRAVVFGLTALTAVGCAPDYVTQDQSSVLFRVVTVNGGAPLVSDVSIGGTVIADNVDVVLAVRAKNRQIPTPQVPMAVFVERYEVRYYRSDGRNTEGLDVPFRVSGNVTTAIDVGEGGADNVALAVEVVRAQAKLEPPLRNLTSLGGSALIMTVFAEITIHGRTVSGDAVQDTGRLQIDFADYQEQ